MKELRGQNVPQDSIVFLTRSETEANTIAKQFGGYLGGMIGGTAGLSAGVAVASLLLPGLGPVFALGITGAALLGLGGADAGIAFGKSATHDPDAPKPTPDEKCSDDVQFFREVLQAGRSLIVIRTESKEIAAVAAGILDRLGMSIAGKLPLKMQVASRQVGDIAFVDVTGRITIGEGNIKLREVVDQLLENGKRNFLLNLAEVQYVDSSGLGELVKTHTTIQNRGGHLKFAAVNKRVYDLLRVTKLASVFDIEPDEASAIASFNELSSTSAVA
jgi:anti-sigma B factor antagonist